MELGHPRGERNRYVSSEVCGIGAYGAEVTLLLSLTPPPLLELPTQSLPQLQLLAPLPDARNIVLRRIACGIIPAIKPDNQAEFLIRLTGLIACETSNNQEQM